MYHMRLLVFQSDPMQNCSVWIGVIWSYVAPSPIIIREKASWWYRDEITFGTFKMSIEDNDVNG